MKVKGPRPVQVEDVPDGEILIQLAFRKGDVIYNTQVLGPIHVMIASRKMRDKILRKVVMNSTFINASQVFDIKLDAGVEDLELIEPGEIGDMQPEGDHRNLIAKPKGLIH